MQGTIIQINKKPLQICRVQINKKPSQICRVQINKKPLQICRVQINKKPLQICRVQINKKPSQICRVQINKKLSQICTVQINKKPLQICRVQINKKPSDSLRLPGHFMESGGHRDTFNLGLKTWCSVSHRNLIANKLVDACRTLHTQDGPRAKFQTTQTIHISVSKITQTSLATRQARYRQPPGM